MRRWKLLTFDVTNTLLRVRGSPAQQYVREAARHGVHIPVKDLEYSYDKVWKTLWAAHPNYGSTTGLSQKQWWRKFVTKVRTYPVTGIKLDLLNRFDVLIGMALSSQNLDFRKNRTNRFV